VTRSSRFTTADTPPFVRSTIWAEAADGSKLALTVDDSRLGKTQIVVIHANDQIFAGLRPTTESAGGYAAVLVMLVRDSPVVG
jgi:hypothetical protein